jgi:hypothetical protein
LKDEHKNGNGYGMNLGQASTLTAQTSLCGWASPKTRDFKSASCTPEVFAKQMEHPRGKDLSVEATLAGWATPMAGSPATEDYNAAGNTDSSRKTVELAAWPVLAEQWGIPLETVTPMLIQAAEIAVSNGWTHFGIQRNSCTAEIRVVPAGGQLNPEHSLWLQGILRVWASFGLRAMQSVSRRRKRSSKAISKRKAND